MASKVSDNAKTAGDVLYWTNIGADTPVVYSYTCPVDTHKVIAAVRLGYSGATQVDATPVCPLHDATLTGEAAIDVS